MDVVLLSDDNIEEDRIEEEIEKFDEIAEEARGLFAERARKYGISYKELSVESCIDLMRMKLYRMKSDNLGYKIDDEMLDLLNYSIIMKILHEEEKE